MAAGPGRPADGAGPGPARWRPLRAPGRPEGGAGQSHRFLRGGRARHPARQPHPLHRRGPPSRPQHCRQPGRRCRSGQGPRAAGQGDADPGGGRHRQPPGGADPGSGADPDRRFGDRAEHRHPAQPRQPARRGRADHPAPGQRPHRGAAAWRAGHRGGQAHDRRHRDPGVPRGGGRQCRRRAGQRPGAAGGQGVQAPRRHPDPAQQAGDRHR